MKKTNLKILILSLANIIVFTSLLCTITPSQIPLGYNSNEIITSTISKWYLFILIFSPVIFSLMACFGTKKHCFLFNLLSFFSFYENVMIFIILLTSNKLEIGSKLPISPSILIFLPLSISILISRIKFKKITFKSKLAFRFKSAHKDEFLWIQTHIFARDVFMVSSLILFVVSVVFSFFKLLWIEAIIFAVIITISTLIVYFFSKSMLKKYLEMEARKNKLSKNKKEKV